MVSTSYIDNYTKKLNLQTKNFRTKSKHT